jgi:hypothetical protein
MKRRVVTAMDQGAIEGAMDQGKIVGAMIKGASYRSGSK